MAGLSARLNEIVEALPLKVGMRVLEIGCGPGALAREIAVRVGPEGAVLGIDRSATAIRQAKAAGYPDNLSFRVSDAAAFRLEPGEEPYDIALAIRVGALDGRHPKEEAASVVAIAAALVCGGRLLIDGGDPLLDIELPPLKDRKR